MPAPATELVLVTMKSLHPATWTRAVKKTATILAVTLSTPRSGRLTAALIDFDPPREHHALPGGLE